MNGQEQLIFQNTALVTIDTRPTIWSVPKSVLVMALLATHLVIWPQESRAQQPGSKAAKADAALIALLGSELDYADFLLSGPTAWHVQEDGTTVFDMRTDLAQFEGIKARITEAMKPLAADMNGGQAPRRPFEAATIWDGDYDL